MLERTPYLRDGAAIYERSFAIIRAEADLVALLAGGSRDRRAHDPCLRPGLGGRLIHFAPGLVTAARER